MKKGQKRKMIKENIKDIDIKINEHEKEEIIKIANLRKEEEIRKSKLNEIINEDIKNIEGENITNENKIEEKKRIDGENIDNLSDNDDKGEDILGNLPNINGEEEEINTNQNQENFIEPLIFDKNKINNRLLSPKTITKDDNIGNINTFCQAFFLVSFSKNCKILKNSNNNQTDCEHKNCSGLSAIEPEIIFKYQ